MNGFVHVDIAIRKIIVSAQYVEKKEDLNVKAVVIIIAMNLRYVCGVERENQ